MTETTSGGVECPICGEGFDPTAAGGWCTNPDCGEWQYLGDEVPEPAETEPDGASSVDDAVDPPATEEAQAGGDGPAQETVAGGEAAAAAPGADAADTESAGAADTESADATDTEATGAADTESVDDTSDDELTLEFGAAPGESVDEGAESSSTEAGESADGDAETAADDAGEEPGTVTCPDCGVDVDADASFCPDCGADLDADESPLEACPACGADVDADDAFCASCGEELADARAGESPTTARAPERLALRARGEEVLVSPDQTVGREIRRILTETGGDEDDAVRIHREHVRFVREDGRFYVVDLGDNPTAVNGRQLSKGDREPVEPGDELALSDVVTLSIERP